MVEFKDIDLDVYHERGELEPGQFIFDKKSKKNINLFVGTINGAIKVNILHLEKKVPMTIPDVYNGYRGKWEDLYFY